MESGEKRQGEKLVLKPSLDNPRPLSESLNGYQLTAFDMVLGGAVALVLGVVCSWIEPLKGASSTVTLGGAGAICVGISIFVLSSLLRK